MPPPPYPRIAHLVGSARGADDDRILDDRTARAFLEEPVRVEEKLDGANVVLWWGDGGPAMSTRGGPGAMDRAGQRGPLRAWMSNRWAPLNGLLADGLVLYAEWLWLVHGTFYERLPAHLLGLDLWRPGTGFVEISKRDALLAGVRLEAPPVLFEGLLHSVSALRELLRTSRFGDAPAEGVVLRRLRPGADPRLAKFVARSHRPRTDEEWTRGSQRNRLAVDPSGAAINPERR